MPTTSRYSALTTPRDLSTLMPAMAPAIRPVTWPDPHDCADQRNTRAVADGRHQQRRFTGAPLTNFGALL